MLPVSQHDAGRCIMNSNDHPVQKGDIGKSNFTNFTTDNGLALDAVSCSATDRFGNLWFGTYGGGVSRYDGKSFTSFTTAQGLAKNMIWSILEDKHGNLWFGTYGGGVSCYDGKSFTSLTTTQGLADNVVYSITEDKAGNLWFGTEQGVSRYDGERFSTYTTEQGLTDNVVHCILQDQAGNIWFGTDRGGVSRFDGKSFVSIPVFPCKVDYSVLSIEEDKSGNIWFGTDGGGVSRYDGKSFTYFTVAQGLAKDNVWSIREDDAGNLWFGTYGGGITRYDGKTFQSYTTAQGLANNCVYSILEDNTGSLWFGTDGGGISRYDGPSFTSYATEQGLPNNMVWSICEDEEGHYWFGTNGGGMSCFNGRSFTSYSTAQGLSNDVVFCIQKDRSGDLWFGTNGGGVNRFNGNTFTTYTTVQGLANNVVRSILSDRNGTLWFGTVGDGVSRFDGFSFTTFNTAQGLANNNVYSILEDKNGNLWFGTDGGGVSYYDGYAFTSFSTAQGLANNSVYCIFEDNTGNIWFGTEEGLSVLRADNLKNLSKNIKKRRYGQIPSSFSFKTFSKDDGISDGFVTNIIQLPNGKIAVGTNNGITLFNPTENFSKLQNIEIFNSSSGYPVKDVNVGQNCMLIDSKGVIWAGTGSEKSALMRFDYTAVQRNNLIPKLVIQKVNLKEEPVCWYELQSKGVRKNNKDSSTAILQNFFTYGKSITSFQKNSLLQKFGNVRFSGITSFYPTPEKLILPYEHNHISFEFVAIETSKPFLINYRYKLEGYDKDWNPVTNRTNASFGNIHEGTYTFILKAQGVNGAWCEPVTYTFEVLPPWYRTWWAYLAYLLMLLSSFQVVSKWRERKLRAEKEKLETLVTERTSVIEQQKQEMIQKNILLETQKSIVEKEKKRSDDLLLNILPGEVAEELKTKGSAEARHYEEVTVLFTDFKDFTRISETMTPKELVAEIHSCFVAIDRIIGQYNIEKIKTIGDSYMCVAGLPLVNPSHAKDVVQAGLEIQNYFKSYIKEKMAAGKESFHIRIGIHTGPVVAGIVGVKKFAYDIWGDTVNTANRMEVNGEVGKVNISGATYKLIKEDFHCIYRGKINVKGKGELDMYFVEEKF